MVQFFIFFSLFNRFNLDKFVSYLTILCYSFLELDMALYSVIKLLLSFKTFILYELLLLDSVSILFHSENMNSIKQKRIGKESKQNLIITIHKE